MMNSWMRTRFELNIYYPIVMNVVAVKLVMHKKYTIRYVVMWHVLLIK